jgi:hypothetical protein
MLKKMKSAVSKVSDAASRVVKQSSDAAGYALMSHLTTSEFAERSMQLQGRMAARSLPRGTPIEDLSDVEFRVYSQWGEDGIIEWLAAHVPVPNTRFIEFGVETFREANCRFLMHNRNWKGLVMDGSEANMAALRQTAAHWMYDLTAKTAFITVENINQLITEAGFGGDLGILSIDLDGNDYWIWQATTTVNPAIIICEYNPIFGDTAAVSVPYDPALTRFKLHQSGLCFGTSIAALKHIAAERGYVFLGTNANGINAFFVRKDLAGSVLPLIRKPRAFPSRHRDSRDAAGNLSYTGGLDRFALIADCPVVNVVNNTTMRLGDIKEPYSSEWLAAMH